MFNLGNQQAKQPNQQAFADNQNFTNQQANFDQTSNQLNQAPQGFFKIPEQYLKLISLAPFALEMLTGQKLPATGVMADILNGVQGLQANLQQVLSNQRQLLNGQQQLWTKLESLEADASNQLNSLSQQVANTKQDFRIFATETKKSLEFHGDRKDLEQARKFIPKPELEPNYEGSE